MTNPLPSEFYGRFQVFHELMNRKIREILLVASPYDAYVMEEDGRLASRIINEYHGHNLSQPPRVTRTSSAYAALEHLNEKKFDMVIATPHLEEMDPFSLGVEIKKTKPDLPIILLAQTMRGIYPLPEDGRSRGIDKLFIWSGVSDFLLALVKSAEDRINVEADTRLANVRVLILVEDSPLYYSSFLPVIYKEIVRQTQAVLEVGLNEEHRLLTMRARPKILLAENFEDALTLCEKYRPFLFGIISDARFPMENKVQEDAGFLLLSRVRKEIPDLPLLLLSSDPRNREKADLIPAVFLNKNSPSLLSEIHDFFLTHLGFGDFVFRMPDGTELDRATNLRELEEKVAKIPDESLWYHAARNHFSNWIMARSEITLASAFRAVQASEFTRVEEMREYIISNIHSLRKWRQKGVVAQFHPKHFDPEVSDFVKIGQGSLGGKGRSLAFMSALFQEDPTIYEKYPDISIQIPRTLVISTEGFESFVEENKLERYALEDYPDREVTEAFLHAEMPDWLLRDLESYLTQTTRPLSIRSSSLLEDAQFQPYAGLYQTYMVPNNNPDFSVRLRHLISAVKRVYASTYCQAPKAFSRSTSVQPQEEQMAVIIQHIAGEEYGDYFYPAVSGVAQSNNYYPVGPMRREDGIAYVALGLGKTVVEGERALRFSPKHPGKLPQFSSVDDILRNAQRFFYALRIRGYPEELDFERYSNLEKRELDEALTEYPVKCLASTYVLEEHRIRDTGHLDGHKILTFAPILKFNFFPLAPFLCDLLELGRGAMGCPVEIEFAVNLGTGERPKREFYFLQMRPMATEQDRFEVKISPDEVRSAFCFSTQALGNGKNDQVADIIYVKPAEFKPEATPQIAQEIGRLNTFMNKEGRPYLLVGPGRWGSADRWLGIPVQWRDISSVATIVEIRNEQLKADPSQGTHFFQNITSLGVHYVTVTEGSRDFFDWKWVDSLPTVRETPFLRHVRVDGGMLIKIDGRTSECVILAK